MQTRTLVISVFTSLACTTANAESLALVAGRQVSFAAQPEFSVEIGAVLFDEGEYYGGRINYKYSDDIIFYGDFGQTDGDSNDIRSDGRSVNFDGNLFGLGFYRSVEKLDNGFDLAVRGSYHQGDLSVNDNLFNAQGQSIDVGFDASEISLELFVSNPTPLNESGVRWYAGVGIHRIESKATISVAGNSVRNTDKDTDAGASLGLTLPFATGTLYAGAEYVTDANYGIGFRHYFC